MSLNWEVSWGEEEELGGVTVVGVVEVEDKGVGEGLGEEEVVVAWQQKLPVPPEG